MRPIFRFLLVGCLLSGPSLAWAQSAVPVDDLVNLKVQGLSDDVLVALIESHHAVFTLDAADVITLRKRGLSEKVIIAMLLTRRSTPVATPEPPLAPAAIEPASPPSLDSGADRYPSTRPEWEVQAPAAPPVVQVSQTVSQTQVSERTVYVPVAVPVPVYVAPRPAPREPEPVYWGFNGQRRPDAWKETPKEAPKPQPNGQVIK